MTEAEARARAEAFASECGRTLADYEEPRLEFVDDEWWAFFQGKSGQPGDHFSIVITDAGGDTRLVEGR
jgi:hypothetical protein